MSERNFDRWIEGQSTGIAEVMGLNPIEDT